MLTPDVRRDLLRNAALGMALGGIDVLVFSASKSLAVAAYALAGYTVFAARLWHPVWVFGFLWLHCVVAAVILPDYRPTVGLLAALYTVAAYRDRRTAIAALGAAFVTGGIASAQEATAVPRADRVAALVIAAVLYTMLILGAWGVGRWARRNRRTVRYLERRRREAIAAERARLSRELHDIVAHAVTMMILQSAGAKKVVNSDPVRAGEALQHIEDLGTQAIAELRRLLQVLRAAEPSDHRQRLNDLDALLDASRTAGADIRCVREGPTARLDPSVSLAAYRIVQEAITNATKHAPGAPIEIRLTWGRQLLLEINNGAADGVALPWPSTGSGLLGLEQRVSVTGGDFSAGPARDGGFRVRAALPLAGAGDGEAQG